jgi:hypothetical protein
VATPMSKQGAATPAQLRALKGVRDREVCLGRWGELVYDGKEIHGGALASCRRRYWIYINYSLGNHGRYVLSAAGESVLGTDHE